VRLLDRVLGLAGICPAALVLATGLSCSPTTPSTPTPPGPDTGSPTSGGGKSGGGGSPNQFGGPSGTGGGSLNPGDRGTGGSNDTSGTGGSGGPSGTDATGGSDGNDLRGTGGGAAAAGPGAESGGNAGGTGGRGLGGGATGGGPGSGGRGTGGSGTGGAGTGGSGPTACNLPNHSGSGSFTYYWFGQGTAREGNGYRTACGYSGTENGQTDTVSNIASMSPASATYFAAIPGTSGFNSSARCGACVQITGQNGRMIVATIADECPYGSDGGNSVCANNPNGHLDLSKAAFDQLGYSVGNPTGTNWKFVPCPVTGNVVIRLKTGNPNELFVENSILAVTGVQGASRTSYGTWHFGANLAVGQSVTLTDAAGRTLTVQVASTTQNMNQDTGRQFPACL